MNENEIERIAKAVHVLRPDWPESSLRTLIAKRLDGKTRRDVTVALAWVACESASSTPARVLEAGPWWKAAAAGDVSTRYRPPRADEMCQIHLAGYADACPGCRADELAGDTTPTPERPADATAWAERARAALRTKERA